MTASTSKPSALNDKQVESDVKSNVVVQRRFTWTRIRRLGEFCAGVQFAAIVFFAVFGNTFISMRPFVREPDTSFLLFPGTKLFWIVDVFYFMAISLGPCVCGPLVTHKRTQRYTARLSEQILATWNDMSCIARYFAALSVVLLLVFLTHLLGNVHYQFYYYIGVLPDENHFLIYDIRSFGASFSGACLIALPVIVIALVVYAFLYLLSGRLCFDTVVIKKDQSDVERGSIEK